MRYPRVITSDLYEGMADKLTEGGAMVGVGFEGGPEGLLYVIARSGFGSSAYVVFKPEQIDEIIGLLQDVKAERG